jgi:TPP-dependent pyruvate/acetoin dehydrogenase alpha subunit
MLEMSRTEREVSASREKSKSPAADKVALAGYDHRMLAIRRLEEARAKADALRKFAGFLHPYIGQEAVAMPARPIIAEVYGKETGCSRGLGG